jgi:hypothetical protein
MARMTREMFIAHHPEEVVKPVLEKYPGDDHIQVNYDSAGKVTNAWGVHLGEIMYNENGEPDYPFCKEVGCKNCQYMFDGCSCSCHREGKTRDELPDLENMTDSEIREYFQRQLGEYKGDIKLYIEDLEGAVGKLQNLAIARPGDEELDQLTEEVTQALDMFRLGIGLDQPEKAK